ncbi:MAG: hypothetical protein WC548_00025 [Candidatus Pacearchaeota archaeon]
MKNYLRFFGFFLILLLASFVASFDGAAGSTGFSGSTNYFQSYQPTFDQLYAGQINDYWPILTRMESDQCNATSDFLIGIPPGGCSPMVVRSDLLEEQNVPVFCQLYAVKVNPLIKVSSIKSISFKGDYPDGISGISFHPARAAVRSYTTLLGDPVINNIGYVVIILKRNKVEKNMEEWISGNLTATIYYDAEEAFGTGSADYYLPLMSDDEWGQEYERYSFWYGKGYLRLSDVGGESAHIEVLKSKDDLVRSYNLREGETGELLYFPGYYCRAGLEVRLNEIVAPENSALLNIDGEEFWVREGSRILNDQCRIGKIDANDRYGNIKISCPSQYLNLSLGKTKEKLEDLFSGIDDDFDKSKGIVDELIDEYGFAKKDNLEETWGEEALFEQIVLAGNVGKFKTQSNLMMEFLDKYPQSSLAERVRFDLSRMNGTDFSKSFGSVITSNKFHSISVVDFKAYDKGDKKVDFQIGGKDFVLGEEEEVNFLNNEYIAATKVDSNEVRFEYYQKSVAKGREGVVSKRDSVIISEGEYGTLGGREIYVRDIDVVAVAHVSLLPKVKATKTTADFSFNIGIEKRNVELSPDKTEEMLKNLNESIKKWEDINSKLNNLVKAWKGACFATSGILMVKNMISGFSGESLARQKVMKEYKQVCAEQYKGMTSTECYNKLASEIEGRVNEMTDALNSVNQIMDQSVKKFESDGLFGEGTIINQAAYVGDLRKQLEGWTFSIPGIDGVVLTADDLTTSEQMRGALLEKNLRETPSGEIVKKELEIELRNVALNKQNEKERDGAALRIKEIIGGNSPKVQSYVSKEVQTLRWDQETFGEYNIQGVNAKSEDKIQFLNYNGKDYLLILDGGSGISGSLSIRDAYVLKEGRWVDEGKPVEFNRIVFLAAGVSGSCSNQWPTGDAKLSYYESGNVKGLPAIVPFNLREGWYAMVPNSGGTFLEDSPQGYTNSGDVSYFKICNIGANRLMESGMGDDLCQTFDVNSAGSVDKFIPCPSLESSKVRDLYVKAREAIRQASTQKDSKIVSILGERIEVGAPMNEITGFECQDFMSAADCKLMFNVCDPVICPPSRCNLGGKMPVSDVIQTGIIGSLVLCLPNAAEGIVVPICVSGVAAGIDSFVSILEAEKECLQTSLVTGEHVGICDEITSIYMCEFFWRQLSPVLDMLIPRFIENLYSGGSQRTRGGGEYMLVQNAWDNLQETIDYFQNVYAPNAFKAFRLRNIQEAGGEVCKAFIGTSFPSSAESIDSLLEPESPSQFYAQFSEMLFTEATVPSTSQYKVYYHIYAGNDVGAQYRVYLKSPPEYSYYSANPIVNVKTGYIAKGDYVDESVDFTAPSGYKELCVVINAQEECGFKQVTSDFAIDYLSKKYVEEQVNRAGIISEKECISGSPSALAIADLNVQSGVESSLNPEIALDGIVRVCASKNPGMGLSNEDLTRWKDVGYCGEVNTRCWLDIGSVKNDLETIEAVENTSISILDQQRGLLENEQLTLENIQKVLSKAREDIKKLKVSDLEKGENSEVIIKILEELGKVTGNVENEIGAAGTNSDRAEALALKATIYRMIVMEKFKKDVIVVSEPEPIARVGDGCGTDDECEPDYCVNGACVMCRNGDDCSSGVCLDGTCTEKGKDEIVCETDNPYWLVDEDGFDVYVKFDEEKKKWMYLLENSGNEYREILPTIDKMLAGNIKLSEFSILDLEKGCELMEKKI